jgi:hypothetical protein
MNPQACERHAKLGLFEPCCDDCYKAEAAREAPADAPPATIPGVNAPHFVTGMSIARQPSAEPPAPPAHEVDAGGEEYRDILRRERDEARAEVARLQEELKQAQITLLLGRGRADELSSLMRLILSWTEADAYGHRNEDQSGWRERAATARRAAELLESTLHLRDVAEAEAQALRAGLTEALEHYGNLAYSELKPSPYYDREEAKITRLSALLSPAQEQK